jgi:hypothetical protein
LIQNKNVQNQTETHLPETTINQNDNVSWGVSSPLCFQKIVKCNMRQTQLYYCIKYLIIHINIYMFRSWT